MPSEGIARALGFVASRRDRMGDTTDIMADGKRTALLREPQDLGLQIGYQVQMAHLVLTNAARLALEPFDVTPARLAALLLIHANPGCDQSTLGRALSVNRSSAMKLVNHLIERGLVERRPGRDLRSNALHLTAEGAQRLRAMTDVAKAADAQVTAALSPKEREMLAALLHKIRNAAEPPLPDSGDTADLE